MSYSLTGTSALATSGDMTRLTTILGLAFCIWAAVTVSEVGGFPLDKKVTDTSSGAFYGRMERLLFTTNFSNCTFYNNLTFTTIIKSIPGMTSNNYKKYQELFLIYFYTFPEYLHPHSQPRMAENLKGCQIN